MAPKWNEWLYEQCSCGSGRRLKPEVSLEIWEEAIKKKLPETGKCAYEQITDLLRRERGPMAALGREAEWKARVRGLREVYKRRRLFVEILDELLGAGCPIFGSQKG